eukprot:m.58222 g.58222  ORF g.58222 m.58222 type:complete len:68 (+) comp13756_c1_seq4:1025-1228(+)
MVHFQARDEMGESDAPIPYLSAPDLQAADTPTLNHTYCNTRENRCTVHLSIINTGCLVSKWSDMATC